MPRGDRTGPNGMGSMTGRGMGFCSGSNQPGFLNQAGGRGLGRGYGMGRGMGPVGFRGFFRGGFRGPFGFFGGYQYPPAPAGAYPSREQELDSLKNQSEYLQQSLEDISKRIADLESND